MSKQVDSPARQWCREAIEGFAGYTTFCDREVYVPSDCPEVEGAYWVLKCLANPACEGSQRVLDEILARRARQGDPAFIHGATP